MEKLTCATAAIALVCATFATGDASALTRYTSAGTICHPANGGAAPMFVRQTQSLAHVGSSDQFVVCDLTQEFGTSVVSNEFLAIEVNSTAAGRTVTCTVQIGFHEQGVTTLYRSVARTHAFTAPGESISLQWAAADMIETGPWQVLMLSCRMAPGTRLGTIRHIYGDH
jgi:hypothetical protein